MPFTLNEFIILAVLVLFTLGLFCLLFTTHRIPAPFPLAEGYTVLDGSTIETVDGTRILIHGLKAPPRGSEAGEIAHSTLIERLEAGPAVVHPVGPEKNDTLAARILVDDADVGQEMFEAGMDSMLVQTTSLSRNAPA